MMASRGGRKAAGGHRPRRAAVVVGKTNDGIAVILPVEHNEQSIKWSTSPHRHTPPSNFTPPSPLRRTPPSPPIVLQPSTANKTKHAGDYAARRLEIEQHNHARQSTIAYTKHYEEMSGGDEPNSRMVQDNRMLREEMEDLVRKQDTLKLENESLAYRLKDALKQKTRDTDVDQVKDRVAELETIRAALIHQLETLNFENESLSRQFDEAMKGWKGPSDVDVQAWKEKIKEAEAAANAQLEGVEREHERRHRILQSEMEDLRAELERSLTVNERTAAESAEMLHSTVSVERERELLRQIETLTRNAESDRRRMEATARDLESERNRRVPVERETELLAQTDRISTALSTKEKLIEELRKDKRDLAARNDEACKKLVELENFVARQKNESAQWESQKSTMHAELDRIKAEVGRLKVENASEVARMKAEAATKAPSTDRTGLSNDAMHALRELVREQESHIADLQREVESLRLTIADYQQEIDKLRGGFAGMTTDRPDPSHVYDLAGAHRRLLEENARVIALLERQPSQKAAGAKTAGATSGLVASGGYIAPSGFAGHKAAASSQGVAAGGGGGRSDVQIRLDMAQGKLKTSSQRIKQLEEWLDEIYKDKNFDAVVKGGVAPSGGFDHDPVLPTLRGVDYKAMQDNRRSLVSRKKNATLR